VGPFCSIISEKDEEGIGAMKIQWIGVFILSLFFLILSEPSIGGTSAKPSAQAFKEEVKGTIKKLSLSLIDPLSKNEGKVLQEALNNVVSEAEREGKPIRFGIGVLDREGLAIAGRYIVGAFKEEDFSRYNFLTKAFKQKKIILDRLFFQDQSELLIVCVPLVQKREVIGALVLGFDPSAVKRDYGLTTEQFMALNFNK